MPTLVRTRLPRFAVAMPFVVLAITVCGEPSGQGNSCQSTGADVTIIAQSNNTYDKPNLTITRGQKVCWQISGATTHTVTADPATPVDSNWIVVNATINANTVALYTFSRAGDYPYHCFFHAASSNMRGTIHVPL